MIKLIKARIFKLVPVRHCWSTLVHHYIAYIIKMVLVISGLIKYIYNIRVGKHLQHPFLLFGLQGMDFLREAIEGFVADAFGKFLRVIQARMYFRDNLEEVHAHDRAEFMH